MDMLSSLLQAAPDPIGLTATINELRAAGAARCEQASFQVGLILFAVLSLAVAAMYCWRYWYTNHSLRGIERGLFSLVGAIAIPYAVMVIVGYVLPTQTAFGLLLSRHFTKIIITGPADIVALGMLAGHTIAHV